MCYINLIKFEKKNHWVCRLTSLFFALLPTLTSRTLILSQVMSRSSLLCIDSIVLAPEPLPPFPFCFCRFRRLALSDEDVTMCFRFDRLLIVFFFIVPSVRRERERRRLLLTLDEFAKNNEFKSIIR